VCLEDPATVPTRLPALTACLSLALLLLGPVAVRAEMPPWLPRYEVDVQIEVDRQLVIVKERVTWTNPHQAATNKVVFNAHAHYSVPAGDVGFLAKMLEILRLAPREALDFNGPPLEVKKVRIVPDSNYPAPQTVPFGYARDNDTALE